MDQIIIDGLEIFANHGVFPEENRLGQKFVISAVLYADTRLAGKSDDLEKSIHYGEVSQTITEFVQGHTFQLIETVVERLAEELLLSYPLLEGVRLRIEKPWAPVGLPLRTVGVEIQRGWHTAYVAFGSNLGDRKAYVEAGIEGLRRTKGCQVQQVSEYFVTEPYGGVEQEEFLNGVLCLRTLMTPQELLERLHELEQEAKRERIVRWGPRTLDLDILFYDDCVIDTEELHIPHIDLENRDFVLKPMAQLAPYLRHPVLNRSIQQLWDDLQRRGI
ncbi:MAG: 2-amino-4-hydroxy-6-hydroxymethyldihydropteridine diphosphokinase [Blautia sp.]